MALDAAAPTPLPPDGSRRRRLAPALTASTLEAVLLALCCALAFVPFTALYPGARYRAYCAGAVAVVLAVDTAAQRVAARRRRRLPAAPLALAALALWAAATVGRNRATSHLPGPGAWAELWRGLTGGWSLMLTAGTPLDDAGAVAVLPVLGAGIVTLAAIRLRRLERAVWPLLPPLAALVVGCAYAGHLERRTDPVVVAALVGCVVGVLALRGGRQGESVLAGAPLDGQSVRGRPTLGSSPVLAVVLTAVGVAASLAVPLADDADRVALRDWYGAPVVVRDAVSPLTRVSAEAGAPAGADRVAFRVTFEDVPEGTTVDRVSLAVLDTFDGSVWSNAARFDRAGSVLPAGWAPGAGGAVVAQRYELPEGWESSFVPVAGRPERLRSAEKARLGYDGDTATLVTDRPGELAYEVTSTVASVDAATLAAEPVARDPRAAAMTALPTGVPAELSAFLAGIGGDGDAARLLALEQELRSARFGYSPLAAPGHSLGRIAAMVPGADPATATDAQRVGTAEQYAAAYAVLARMAGYPARVVVGYRIDPAAAASGAAVEVRASALTAWPEVLFASSGWVRFDPTNPTRQDPQREPDDGSDASVPASAPLETQAVENCLELGTCLETAGGGPAPRTIAALIALALLASVPIGLLLARALQRAGRRRGPAARQVVGAWQTSRDRLRLARVPVPPGTTVAETVPLVASGPGEDGARTAATAELVAALHELAPLVDAALFDPAGPPDGAVAAGRRCERAIARAVAARHRPVRRVLAALDPRPLGWSSPRGRAHLAPSRPAKPAGMSSRRSARP